MTMSVPFIGSPRRAGFFGGLPPFFVSANDGLSSSRDLVTFTLVNAAPVNKGNGQIVYVPAFRSIVYMGGASQDTAYASFDGGRTFGSTVVDAGKNGFIATDGTDVIAVFEDGHVYRSTDGGASFSLVATLPAGAGAGIGIGHVNGTWMAYKRETAGTRLYYSADGTNWSNTAGPFPNSGSYSYVNLIGRQFCHDGTKYMAAGYDYNGMAGTHANNAAAIDSWGSQQNIEGNYSAPGAIFCTAGLALISGVSGTNVATVWRSTDHGASWTKATPAALTGTNCFLLGVIGGVFHIASAGRIYSTTDGVSFTRVDGAGFTDLRGMLYTR